MNRLSRQALRRDDGAFAVLFALIVVVLVGLAALVVDQSALRLDKRADRSATDAAAIAGAQALSPDVGAVPNPQTACQDAFHYAWTNLAVPTSSLPPDNCGSLPTRVDTCTDNTAANYVSESYANGDVKWTVTVVWPVPGLPNVQVPPPNDLMVHPDLENWTGTPRTQGITSDDGRPCDRVGVAIHKTRPQAFGGIFSAGDKTTTSASVAVLQADQGPGKQVVPLVVLDKTACNALNTSGGGGIQVLSGINSAGQYVPGMIGVDSDGSGSSSNLDCTGGKSVMSASLGGGSPTNIWAYDAPGPVPARILSYALPRVSDPNTAFPQAEAQSCTNQIGVEGSTPPNLGDQICPKPDPAAQRIGDAFITDLYNCTDNSCAKGYIDLLKAATADPANDSSFTPVVACGPSTKTLIQPTATRIFVDSRKCPGGNVYKIHGGDIAAFPGSAVVVFSGDVQVFSGGCLLFNAVWGGPQTIDQLCHLSPNNPLSVHDDAAPIVIGGNLDMGGSLIAPQTFIYQPTGRLNVSTNDPIYWTAPYANNKKTPATNYVACDAGMTSGMPPVSCFKNLSYWGSYNSDTTNPSADAKLTGQSGMFIEGIWYLPNSAFDFDGGSQFSQRHAQFIVKRLTVTGAGGLYMVPDSDRAAEISLFGVLLIR